MRWGDGLRAQPDALQSQAAGIRTAHAEMSQIRDSFKQIDVGPWQGPAADKEAKRRQRVVQAIDRQLQQLPPVAEALEGAATSFAEIQSAQHGTIDKAHRWEFSIDDGGGVHNEAGFSIDPRRPFIRMQLEGSVISLVFRLSTTDVGLAGRLVWNDAKGDLGELMDSAGNFAEDGMEWVGDRISDGMDWASDQWDEHVAPRLDAGGKAWDRLTETFKNPPEWFKEWRDGGKPPYIAQVGGEAITVLARGAGVIANLVTGEDQHISDDGVPWVGDTRRESGNASIGGINDLMRITMDTYGRGDADRNSVTVTAVEDEQGNVRYIASIPGTAEGMVSKAGWGGAPSGLDWAANFMHIGEGPTAATQAAADAVQQSIAEDIAYRRANGLPVPDGPPELLLTGHSQGGIIAGQMVTDPSYLEGLHVKGIVSAGSPQQTLDMNPDVPVHNFQTQYDPVPRADINGVRIDGSSDPTPDVGNITLPHSGGSDLGNYLPGYTHLQETYMKDVETLVGGQGSPENLAAVAEINKQYGGFLNGQTTTYKTQFGREYE